MTETPAEVWDTDIDIDLDTAAILTVTRDVTQEECPWLSATVTAGTTVRRFWGCTYTCVQDSGIAVSVVEGKFFELPRDAVKAAS